MRAKIQKKNEITVEWLLKEHNKAEVSCPIVRFWRKCPKSDTPVFTFLFEYQRFNSLARNLLYV